MKSKKNYFIVIISVICFMNKQSLARNDGYISYNTAEELVNALQYAQREPSTIAENAIKELEHSIDELCSIEPEARNRDNTLRAYDRINANLYTAQALLLRLSDVAPDQAIQEASLKLKQASIDLLSSDSIYQAFVGYRDHGTDHATLSEEERYRLNQLMEQFTRDGFNLSDEIRAQTNDLRKKISELELLYAQNLASDTQTLRFSAEELAGVEQFIETLEPTKDNEYIVELTPPTYNLIMSQCIHSETRRQVWSTYESRAYPTNKQVLEQVIALRAQLAQLLGFDNFSAYSISDQMAEKPNHVREFINGVWQLLNATAHNECKQLKENLDDTIELSVDEKFYPWDYPYVLASYKQSCELDDQAIAEYFPLEHTIEGLFAIYEQFLGLRFEITTRDDLWVDDLKLIQIFNAADDQLLGFVILDLHPRPGKFTHVCCSPLSHAICYQRNGQHVRTPSAAVIIANFTKPTAEKPALLTHQEVVTFFHEFGHAMHGVLGITELNLCSGTRVKTDFLELPSQMFECWMWEPEILKQISRHYQTGVTLSDELIQRMINLRYINAGVHFSRQCALAMISLEFFENSSQDIDAQFKEIWSTYIPVWEFNHHNRLHVSFPHLTHYGSRYYSYLWSLVFAYDVFAQIKQEGLFNPETGKRFVQEILGRGASADPNELLKNYLGRAPTPDAFIHEIQR